MWKQMNATLNMTLLAYYVIANKRTLNRSRAYNSPINVRKLWYWIAVCLKCSLAELNFYSAANGYVRKTFGQYSAISIKIRRNSCCLHVVHMKKYTPTRKYCRIAAVNLLHHVDNCSTHPHPVDTITVFHGTLTVWEYIESPKCCIISQLSSDDLMYRDLHTVCVPIPARLNLFS